MDPNANLREQEEILMARRDFIPSTTEDKYDRAKDMMRLCELRIVLDGWLARGGFAPEWGNCPLATVRYERLKLTTRVH